MSTISCGSCGMQYDGSGLQAGVQFQCTQCGSMVQVGAARAPKAAGAKPRAAAGGPKRAGAATRGPARAAGGARPAGPARGGQQGGQQERPGYGPPRKSGNAGLFVGLGVGAVVLVLIIVVVVSTSGPTPEDKSAEDRKAKAQAQRDEIERKNAEIRAQAEALEKPQKAALAMAPSIESALKNGDAAALEAMFDWQSYARYNADLVAGNSDFLYSTLITVGSWAKNEEGAFTGIWEGKAAHGADGLRERVMYYIKEFYFGQQELAWDQPRTEAGDAMKMQIGSTEYIGRKIFIAYKGSSGEKEFWVGAPRGSDAVKILNLFDKSATKNLQGIEAKREKADDRNPQNPDRDPRNPERDPTDPTDPTMPPDDFDPDANLPVMAKTGAMPTSPALVNAVNELAREKDLNTARMNQIREEPSAEQKKATMGAFIDLLVDAQKAGDRAAKLRLSKALWAIWRPFCPADWGEAQMVYSIEGFSSQNAEEMPVRRWLQVYAEYKTD